MGITNGALASPQGFYKKVGASITGDLSDSVSVSAGDVVVRGFSCFSDDASLPALVKPTISEGQALTWDRSCWRANVAAPNTQGGIYLAKAAAGGTLSPTLANGNTTNEFSVNFATRVLAGAHATSWLGEVKTAAVSAGATSASIQLAAAAPAGAAVFALLSLEAATPAGIVGPADMTTNGVQQSAGATSGFWFGHKILSGAEQTTAAFTFNAASGGGVVMLAVVLPSTAGSVETITVDFEINAQALTGATMVDIAGTTGWAFEVTLPPDAIDALIGARVPGGVVKGYTIPAAASGKIACSLPITSPAFSPANLAEVRVFGANATYETGVIVATVHRSGGGGGGGGGGGTGSGGSTWSGTGNTVTAAGPSLAQAQAAVDAAVAGDYVSIPAGYAEFSGTSQLNVGKRLYIILDPATHWKRTGTANLDHPLVAFTAAGCRITGGTVEGNLGNGSTTESENDVGIGFYGAACVDFVVHDMTITHFGYAGVWIDQHNTPRGLIARCNIIDNFNAAIGNLGYGVMIAGNNQWPALALGTAEAVFVERCTLKGNRHDTAANDGTRYVTRHNEIIRTTPVADYASTDAHGNTGAGVHGTRSVEVYGNVYSSEASKTARTAIGLRGGDGVIWGNTINSGIAYAFELWLESALSSYPVTDQIRDLWIWGNTISSFVYGYADADGVKNQSGGYVQKDRDYFVGTAKPGYTPYTFPHPALP